MRKGRSRTGPPFFVAASTGAALAAALGFGATQAFADAPRGSSAGAARACDPDFCDNYCIGAGYAGGSCVPNGHGGFKCLCY